MTAKLDQLVAGLRTAAGLSEQHPATVELRAAAARLQAAAAATLESERQRWVAAVRALAGAGGVSAEALLVRSWRLPAVAGVELVAPTLARAVLAGDRRLLDGRGLVLPLGPLELVATLPPAVVRPPDGAAVLAGLLPPSGVAAGLTAGPVRVEGGVVREGQAWSGTLSGSVGTVSAGAFAHLAADGGVASFVAVLGARFTPAIQLGFGFEISTLGGAVGVNVGTDVDALRATLSSGSAVALFFPTAPVEAAERAARLALLPQVFPTRPGSVVAGPSAELTWLQIGGVSFLRLSLVALLELPRARVVVVGRAEVSVPPVLDLRLDVLGEVDPAHGVVALDMTVVRGRVLGVLKVDGTMALRLRTAEPAHALLTIGGFYPGYRSEVAGLPPQRRIAMGPDLPLPITFRFEGYLAVTDGTFQVGARVEIGFSVGVSVHGFLQFDAIGQFDPFHVHARLAGGIDVRALGVRFGGVEFEGTFDGPGPVVVRGRVSVSVLGARAGWNDAFRFGEDGGPAALPAVVDLLGLMVQERERDPDAVPQPLEVPPARLTAIDARDPLVDVDPPPRDPAGRAVVTPLGAVVWSQTTAPFDVTVHRMGGRRLASPRRMSLYGLSDGMRAGPTELFAPAALRDADRETLLTQPAYERLASGIEARLDPTDVGTARSAPIGYEEWYPEEDVATFPGLATPASRRLVALLADRHAPPRAREQAPRLELRPETWRFEGAGASGSASSRTDAVFRADDWGGLAADVVAVPAAEPAHEVAHLWSQP